MSKFTKIEQELFYAIYRGKCKDVDRLLYDGADPGVEDPASGMQPIHLAARYGNIKILSSLLRDNRVRADSVDRRGKVPYEWAEEFSHAQAESLLVNEILAHPSRYGMDAVNQAKHHVEIKTEPSPKQNPLAQ